MSVYSVTTRNYIYEYDSKYQYPEEYYNTNFYNDHGVIRREVNHNSEEKDIDDLGGDENFGGAVAPKDRRIELFKVLHYFLDKNHIKINELIGDEHCTYQFDTDTHCLCGQNSKLYLCKHIESGRTFYMGSECIKLFHPEFIPEGVNGFCVICMEHLRKKGNIKKGKVKNYDGNCEKICLRCLNNIAMERIEEEANEKKRQEKAIKILTLLRKQTNDMLIRHIKRSC